MTIAPTNCNVALCMAAETTAIARIAFYSIEKASQALHLDARCIGVERRLCNSFQHPCRRTGRIHDLHMCMLRVQS